MRSRQVTTIGGILLMWLHPAFAEGAADNRAELDRQIETVARSLQPQHAIWRLERWEQSRHLATGVWRISVRPDGWDDERDGRAVSVRFLACASASDAVRELEQSARAQVTPSGTCSDLAEHCYIWRTHLKNSNPVTLKFAEGATWVQVRAESEGTAVVFARDILESLRKAATPDGSK